MSREIIKAGIEINAKSRTELGDLATIACVSCPMRQLCVRQGGNEAPVCEDPSPPDTSGDSLSYEQALNNPDIPMVVARTISKGGGSPAGAGGSSVTKKHEQPPAKPPTPIKKPDAPKKQSSGRSKEVQPRQPSHVCEKVAQFVCDLLRLQVS